MEISTILRKKARAAGVPWQSYVMADLIALGYSNTDAYAIAYSENSVLNVQRNNAIMESIQKTDDFTALVNERKKAISGSIGSLDTENKLELIGAEETAREILTVAMGMPEKSKERGEMFMKYADLIRKNDTTTKDDEDPIRIYLPAKCDSCPLKKELNGLKKED